jgi:hypothetical protein
MLTLFVETGNGREPQAVRVPLVDAQVMESLGVPADEPVLPQEIIERLELAGHRVQWQRRYAPLWLRDGRRVVFPVDDLHIVPVDLSLIP